MDVTPSSAVEKLGFTQILARLDDLLISEPGRDRLRNMRPAGSVDWLRSELERVTQLQEVLRFDDPVPFEPLPDVREYLRRAAPEDAMLDSSQLFETATHLRTARLVSTYFERRRQRYPALHAVCSHLTPLEAIERAVSDAIEPDGRVRDDASDELRRIRSLISRRQIQLRETIQRELRHAISQGWATEEQPTIRNGRMVIPVRAEAKRKLQGFVQDSSASGQTVYIEPAACLDLNNELRELQGDERREVERILRRLTASLRAHLDDIRQNTRTLAEMDLLQAKARFSNDLGAVAPVLDTDAIIDVHNGRNPVLELHFRRSMSASEARSRVVPLHLQLGGDYRTLIITGPNAGGKTVAMKTVGLFVLMAAHGLPLPADEQTRIPLFHRLMVDIGDQQSIEEDLSTFSSHVSNLRQMLDVADSNTLILIDEAGTGTDPDEGGALAQATLKRLNDRGARTIATTHHGTLKAFAHEEPGVENGSMEFDRETLSPTYRFMPAVPGSSYAFEIARRTGLQDDVLELARELAGRRTSGLEELIGEFEARNQELEKSLIETRSLRAEAERERDLYGERRRKLDRERDDIRRKALEEAERIIARANARVERTIREIKEAEAEREATRVAREKLERFRKELDEVPPSKEPASEKTEDAPEPVAGTISVGDQVVIDSGKTVAEVLEDLEREAVVALGSMRMRVAKKRLTKVGGPRKQQVTVRQVTSSDAGLSAATARNRIDVRGHRVEGALIEVQRLIDEALQTGQKRVEILHGKGTGALRQAIHESLAESPEVASFDDAPWTEGGAGVTYVTLT